MGYRERMRRTCFYHAGCPDGFGAAFAVHRAWGDTAVYVPVGHDDQLRPEDHEGDLVVFVDIAPRNEELRGLADTADQVIVLDHHLSSRDRFAAEPSLENLLRANGHVVRFDLSHSGAVLAWRHFHAGEPEPDLLRYVEDQDLWNWKLPDSEAVNAAIGSYPRSFETWDRLTDTPVTRLAEEGTPILRAQRIEVERALQSVHTVHVGSLRVEAVNALYARSAIGHELARRAAHGLPCGCVYRITGQRVDATLYSIGDLDVAGIAASHGGGGHRNAAGFHVSLREWLEKFV
jgi:oligoribonuclease NrnB/cAMP/cGMP phosphodiesterase (DHH superfamily)